MKKPVLPRNTPPGFGGDDVSEDSSAVFTKNGPVPTDADDPSSFDPDQIVAELKVQSPKRVRKRIKKSVPTSFRQHFAFGRVPDGDSDLRNEPVNAYLVQRAEIYSQDLPAMHSPHSEKIREFFLQIILPISMGVSSGLSDAMEVVRLTTSEDPSGNPEVVAFRSLMQHLVNTALRVKTVSFVTSLTELTSREEDLFKVLDFAVKNGGGNNATVEELMRKLFPVSDLRRSIEGDKGSQVRRLHPPKGSRKPNGTDVDEFVDSKGKRL